MGGHALAIEGLITKCGNLAPQETMNRLETEVRAKGLTVFAHVDHAAGQPRPACRCGRLTS
jgi:uncharacterized protein (DUF302 family)